MLGSELVKQLLDNGAHVMALVHRTPLTVSKHSNLKVVTCDLLDVVTLEEIMEEVQEVYHCAGLISYHPNDRDQLYRINVEATANVVNACLSAGVQKLVHVSSIAALGKFVPGKEIDEETVWTEDARNSAYGYSKYLGELEVWRGVSEGLNAVVVNPSIILGPGDKDNGSTAIFRNIYNGFKWYTEGVNGFVDVRDVALAMIQLMQAALQSERFVVNAENASYKDVFFGIADAWKKPRPDKLVTPALSALVWRLEYFKSLITRKQPLVTRETAHTALAEVRFNNQKLLKALPDFSYRPLTDTIQYTCDQLQHRFNNS